MEEWRLENIGKVRRNEGKHRRIEEGKKGVQIIILNDDDDDDVTNDDIGDCHYT